MLFLHSAILGSGHSFILTTFRLTCIWPFWDWKKHIFVRDTWTRVGYAGHPQLVDVLGAFTGSCGREPYPHTSSPRPQPHWYSIPGKCTYRLFGYFAETTFVTATFVVVGGNWISVLCNVAVHAIKGLHFDATLLRFVLLACPAVCLNLSKLWSLRPPLSWRVNKIWIHNAWHDIPIMRF